MIRKTFDIDRKVSIIVVSDYLLGVHDEFM